MGRLLVFTGFGYIIGMTCAVFFTPLTNPLTIISLLIVAILMAFSNKKYTKISIALIAVSAAFVQYAYFVLPNFNYISGFLEKDVSIKGIVNNITRYGSSVYYTVKGDIVYENKRAGSVGLRLKSVSTLDSYIGEEIICTARLNAPSAQSRNSLLAKGIYFSGSIKEVYSVKKSDSIEANLLRYQQKFADNILKWMPKTEADFMNAMIIGIKSDLDSDITNNMQRTGIIHIMSISGLHVSIITMLLMGMMKKLPYKLSACITIVFLLMFMTVTAFSVTVVRAVIMSIMVLIGNIIGKKNDTLSSLGLAVMIIVIINPYAATGIGFWLSFLSTMGIAINSKRSDLWLKKMFGNRAQKKLLYKIFSPVLITIFAYCFSFPVLILSYGNLSLIAPVVNFFISPFLPILVACGLLTGILSFFPSLDFFTGIAANISKHLIGFVIDISNFFAQFKFCVLTFTNAVLIGSILIAGVILIFRYTRLKNIHYFFKFCILILCFIITLCYNNTSGIIITPVENMLFIRNSSSVVLIGTPNGYSERYLKAYMQNNYITKIEALILPDLEYSLFAYLNDLTKRYSPSVILIPKDIIYKSDTPVYMLDDNEFSLLGLTIKVDKKDVRIQIGNNIIVKLFGDSKKSLIPSEIVVDKNGEFSENARVNIQYITGEKEWIYGLQNG